MRAAIEIGHVLRRSLLRWLRIPTRGVKAMVFNPGGELLLVRNGYGNRDHFLLPGGGVDRGERPEAAAVREVWEEVAIEISDVVPVFTYVSGAEGRRDTIHLFRARAAGLPRADGVEVEEARFFPLDALPDRTSPATLRRIAEHLGKRPIDGRW